MISELLPKPDEWYRELTVISGMLKDKGDITDPEIGAGLCYEGSKRLQDILASKGIETRLVVGDSDATLHYWLATRDGTIIDATEWQFGNPNVKPGQITIYSPGENGHQYYLEKPKYQVDPADKYRMTFFRSPR